MGLSIVTALPALAKDRRRNASARLSSCQQPSPMVSCSKSLDRRPLACIIAAAPLYAARSAVLIFPVALLAEAACIRLGVELMVSLSAASCVRPQLRENCSFARSEGVGMQNNPSSLCLPIALPCLMQLAQSHPRPYPTDRQASLCTLLHAVCSPSSSFSSAWRGAFAQPANRPLSTPRHSDKGHMTLVSVSSSCGSCPARKRQKNGVDVNGEA
ncbi:uncharacterized protein IWZ02DRAFT_178946 [Phyllosticta citriasiana]|uniref:uncharacterized protein n=1 Tax=Phyllosticta citriasiana TaxID=595635 RepID=UPI0030FD43A6